MQQDEDTLLFERYKSNWNLFIKEILGVRLDREQRKIIRAIQDNRRVSVRSGHARGKDYVAAVASLCFLYLNYPSKVINTAPTGRQAISIMMSEIAKIHKSTRVRLGGEVQASQIKFKDNSDWFMLAFKAGDKNQEHWTGFHSPNIMVVITEATGIEQETFDAVEGILTGNSKLLVIFNPIRTTGEAYQSTRSPEYKKFKLNCLDAPNVRARKILIPGQVDYEWVAEKVKKWTTRINEKEIDKSRFDFKFEGLWYRPNDLFRAKVLGEFPAESEGQLIPLSWVEAAIERWHNQKKGENIPLVLGVDVAGMGRDNTCFVYRYNDYIEKIETFNLGKDVTVHMQVAGKVKNTLRYLDDVALIDSIGEGAGVYSRLKELNVNVISVKGSEGAGGRRDITGQYEFENMRAYLHWKLRDALNPQFNPKLALPPDDELIEELVQPNYITKSNGKIIIELKEEIKKRIGRSPDKLDGLLNTFYSNRHAHLFVSGVGEER